MLTIEALYLLSHQHASAVQHRITGQADSSGLEGRSRAMPVLE